MHVLKHLALDHRIASEITPQRIYEQRRALLKGLALGSAGATLAAWASRDAMAQTARPGRLAPLPSTRSAVAGGLTMEKATVLW